MFRIALPKGDSLEESTLRLFKAAGITIVSEPRKYRIEVLFNGVAHEAVLMRPRHIPHFVAYGRYDIGVCGRDRVEESGVSAASIEIIARLPYSRATHGKVKVVLFSSKGNPVQSVLDIPPGTEIFSEYPRLTHRFFAKRDIPVEVIECAGTAEAHIPGDYPYGVCVSETGATLEANGLKPIAVLLESTTVLIASREAVRDPHKREEVQNLKQALLEALSVRVPTPCSRIRNAI